MRKKLADWLLTIAINRDPDFVVGSADDPYMRRWYLIPRNRFFNIYLHEFCRSDSDKEMHTHPWLFNATIVLKGFYIEEEVVYGGFHRPTQMASWDRWFRLRGPWCAHRVILPLTSQRTWTLFITGPIVHMWGFIDPNFGWTDYKTFLAKKGRS